MKLSDGKFFRFPHNDMTALENLLIRERENFKNAFIISESVFSMDGDIEDLKKLVELKIKYNCNLIIDEAHAFGVFGQKGLGVAEELGIINDVDLIVGTFGKAIGSMGAFAVGSRILIDFLINKSRSFIFSTALPPINIAFTKWIIENVTDSRVVIITDRDELDEQIERTYKGVNEKIVRTKSCEQKRLFHSP